MKKVKLVLLMMVISLSSYAQKPWRTLTFTNINGIGVGGKYFNTTSANLYYGLNNNYSIQGWSGYQTHQNPNFQWFSSQTSIVKNFNGLGIGVGVQYGTAGSNSNATYAITTLSYQFKL
jgi:hypothetical protein